MTHLQIKYWEEIKPTDPRHQEYVNRLAHHQAGARGWGFAHRFERGALYVLVIIGGDR